MKDPGFIEAAGDAAEGTISPARASRRRSQQEFFAAYEEEFGAAPAHYAAEAYDAANIFLEGIARR